MKVAQYLLAHGASPRILDTNNQSPFWRACFAPHIHILQWLALTVGVGDDVERAATDIYGRSCTPVRLSQARPTLAAWLVPFLRRRVLIAHWGAGRTRRRCGRSGPGDTVEAAVWRRLPREALADVLLMLAPPPV